MSYDYEDLIDGTPMLLPDAGVELTYTDLDSAESGRDEAGFLHRVVRREGVRSWRFRYSALTAGEYQYLRQLFAGRPTFEYRFRGHDGREETVRAYCSTGSVALYNRRLGLYKNLTFQIIEC